MYDGVSYCRGCGKALKFIRTRRGALMPCDSFPVRYVPDEDGTLLYKEDGTSLRGRIVDGKLCPPPREGSETEYGGIAWAPHFGRCPNPVERERKKAAEPRAALSGNDAILEAARVHAARERAKEEYDRRVAELMEDRKREWERRQMSLFK